MSRNVDRRGLLMAGAGAAWLGPGAFSRASARAPRKRILYFTKSAGFLHSVVDRRGEALAHSERILTEVGAAHGFEVVASKDGRLFEPDRIGAWDGFVFYASGDLSTPGTDGEPPLSADGEKALLDAVRGGKGFVGIHPGKLAVQEERERGVDDPLGRMVGGEFISHGPQQVATVAVADPKFPGFPGGFGRSPSFRLHDEWYALRGMPEDLHAILVLRTEGMEGPEYRRPDYPITWARKHGDGRVFYTSMGHREDVWTNPNYQSLLLGALAWSTGLADADLTPNLKDVAPGYATLPA